MRYRYYSVLWHNLQKNNTRYRIFRIGINPNYVHLNEHRNGGVLGSWVKTSWTRFRINNDTRCLRTRELPENEVDSFITMQELIS